MRVLVRRLELDDLPIRVAWFNNPEVYQNMTIEVPLSVHATQQWYQNAVVDRSRRDFTFVSAVSPDQRLAMGGLVDIDFVHSRAELYMLVSPTHLGKGIGTAVLRWLCNYGFNSLNLNRIYLTTLCTNVRARVLYEKHGFLLEGCLRDHVYHQGRHTDRYILGLLRKEWIEHEWAIVEGALPLEVVVE